MKSLSIEIDETLYNSIPRIKIATDGCMNIYEIDSIQSSFIQEALNAAQNLANSGNYRMTHAAFEINDQSPEMTAVLHETYEKLTEMFC